MAKARRRAPEAPPGYPSHFEISVRLNDRRQVDIRPILPTDGPELAAAIKTADAPTLRARFLGGPPPITDAVLQGLVCLDYVNRFALVAHHRGRGVAIARYAVSPRTAAGVDAEERAIAVSPTAARLDAAALADAPATTAGLDAAALAPAPPAAAGLVAAELAIAVSPEWRRIGLATALIELLARRAHECGITDFTAFFLADNRPVTELAHAGNARVVIADGMAQLSARLTAEEEPE